MVKLEKLVTLEKQPSVEIRYCEIIADATDERRNERARVLKDGERYFFHKMRDGEVVECFEIAVDWKPSEDTIIFAYTPDDRHTYQIDSRILLNAPNVITLKSSEVQAGDRCEYGGHTVELADGAIIFDGRKIRVDDIGGYTYRLLKTKILARDGAAGLFAFLDRIAEEYNAGNKFPLFDGVYQVMAKKYFRLG